MRFMLIPTPTVFLAFVLLTDSASRRLHLLSEEKNTQILLLEGEGVEFIDGKVNLEKHLWNGE